MVRTVGVDLEFYAPEPGAGDGAGGDAEDAVWKHPANDTVAGLLREVARRSPRVGDGSEVAWRLTQNRTRQGGGPADTLGILLLAGDGTARVHGFPALVGADDVAALAGRSRDVSLFCELVGAEPDPPPQAPAEVPTISVPDDPRGWLARLLGRGEAPSVTEEQIDAVDPVVTVHFDRTPVGRDEGEDGVAAAWPMRNSRGTGVLLEHLIKTPGLLPRGNGAGGWWISVVDRETEVHDSLGALRPLGYLRWSADGAASLWPAVDSQCPYLGVLAIRDVDLWVFAEYLPGEPVRL